MTYFLDQRRDHLTELMDDPECDLRKLENTYKSFRVINKLLSGWNTIYKLEIRPYLKQKNGHASLLDVGFGGGDIPILLSRLAKRDGFNLEITAIEIDKRSFNYINKINTPDNITFRKTSSSHLVDEKKKFDFVISNHLIHHLDKASFSSLCTDAEKLSKFKVFFNDIERSDIGYLSFYFISSLLFRDSFISHDGLISIKRSYTFKELQQKAPLGWKVTRVFPYRLILSYEKQ